MEMLKLAIVFLTIVTALAVKPVVGGRRRKVPLSVAILAGVLVAAVLYGIGPLRVGRLALATVTGWETLSLCLITYLITFLQRMMEHRRQLIQAEEALSAIFNSRRVNATAAPMLIGLLPSPAAAFIAGDMVKGVCEGYLDREEQTFVTSYFRHIPESCLPTYSNIVLALSLAGVATGKFLLGMALPVVVLFALGMAFYVRKVPRETGVERSDRPGREWLRLVRSLWAVALAIVLIIAVNCPVYLAVGISVVLYFLVNRFSFRETVPFFVSAFEWNIMSNTVLVMFFKGVLVESGVIEQMPAAFRMLSLPLPIIFALIFLVGTIISGSQAIVAMCIPMAFGAIPDGGTALMVLLMSSSYIAMQVSPTHLCLTLIAEHFHTDLGTLVSKTLPVLACFIVFLVPYYYVLSRIPGF